MKVEFTKEYKDDYGRIFPKGKITTLSKEFAKQLIKSKHAKQYGGQVTDASQLKEKIDKSGLDITIN
jgi:endonuclease YncB( thermonuclease family)